MPRVAVLVLIAAWGLAGCEIQTTTTRSTTVTSDGTTTEKTTRSATVTESAAFPIADAAFKAANVDYSKPVKLIIQWQVEGGSLREGEVKQALQQNGFHSISHSWTTTSTGSAKTQAGSTMSLSAMREGLLSEDEVKRCVRAVEQAAAAGRTSFTLEQVKAAATSS